MAVLDDILDAIQAGITGLSLSGVSSANVLVQKVASDRPGDLPANSFPFVVVAPFGAETVDPGAGTNRRDDVVYPVLVAILARDKQNQTRNAETYYGWRQAIRRKFHHNLSAFGSVASVFNSIVQTQAITDPGPWFENSQFVSGMVIRVSSREGRS